MKKTITTMILCFALGTAWAQDVKPAANTGEKKTVCSDVKDKAGNVIKNKDGSTKQNCRTITVRKKYDATEIPTKK